MKNFHLLSLLGFVLLTGCARHYVVTLNNGTQVGAKDKPRLQDGAYHFKDANGQDASIAAGRVSQIEPASSAARNKKAGFLDSPSK